MGADGNANAGKFEAKDGILHCSGHSEEVKNSAFSVVNERERRYPN
jgi:hypothetical protein